MSNVLAAIGRGQLKVLTDRIDRKRKIFQHYERGLKDIDAIDLMPELAESRSTRWLTTLTIDPKLSSVEPEKIISMLADENIEARRVWKPLHMQPLFKNCKYYTEKDGRSYSEYLFKHGVCLPSGTNMRESEQNRIIQPIRDAFKNSNIPFQAISAQNHAPSII